MTEQEFFVLADPTLNDVVARITDDQWDMRELVRGLWDELSPVADEWRKAGRFSASSRGR